MILFQLPKKQKVERDSHGNSDKLAKTESTKLQDPIFSVISTGLVKDNFKIKK